MKQTQSISLLIVGLVFLSLTACQTTPFDKTAKDASYDAPNVVSADTQIGDKFVWGGQILEVKNEADSTELTILSFPLNGGANPKLEADSNGRFIVIHQGYLEPLDYIEGTKVTVVGNLSGFRDGKVSEANYRFPLLESEDMKLHKQGSLHLPFSISFGFSL